MFQKFKVYIKVYHLCSNYISEIYAFIPITRKKQEISETVSRSTPAHQEETAYGKKKEQEETKREVSGK